MEAVRISETSETSTRLHGGISQKSAAVRTWNLPNWIGIQLNCYYLFGVWVRMEQFDGGAIWHQPSKINSATRKWWCGVRAKEMGGSGSGGGGSPELGRSVTSANENSCWSRQISPADAEVCEASVLQHERTNKGVSRSLLVQGGHRTQWRCVKFGSKVNTVSVSALNSPQWDVLRYSFGEGEYPHKTFKTGYDRQLEQRG